MYSGKLTVVKSINCSMLLFIDHEASCIRVRCGSGVLRMIVEERHWQFLQTVGSNEKTFLSFCKRE